MPAPPRAPIGVALPVHRLQRPNFTVVWKHLIYAYMIENTRAYEVLATGARGVHGTASVSDTPATEAAASGSATTEELFYKDASPSRPSPGQPDPAGRRGHPSQRLLPDVRDGPQPRAGRGAAQPYSYVKPSVANREFVGTFEEFLRDVWRAIENANNTSGANPTDFAAIADQATRLQNMLTSRRGGAATRPNLSREEFLAICLASWLELTLAFDSPIVVELNSTGPSAGERLRHVGDRVGLPAHGRSHNYFIIARRVSRLLIAIEQGIFNTLPGAQTLAAPGPTQQLMSEIVHHWQLISGRDIKSPRTTSQQAPPVGGSMSGSTSAPWAASASAPTNGKVPAGTP